MFSHQPIVVGEESLTATPDWCGHMSFPQLRCVDAATRGQGKEQERTYGLYINLAKHQRVLINSNCYTGVIVGVAIQKSHKPHFIRTGNAGYTRQDRFWQIIM